MLSVEVFQGNLYSRFLFCELALTVKKYAVRALRWRVFLLLLWCVVSCLPASCSLRDHKNEHWLERTSGGSQSIPTATAIPSIQHFWCAPWEEGKLPTKSVETWAVVSWLDCWAGILEEKISQRRQGSTRSWQWVVYVNLCRLPPQTGWTQPLQTWFFFRCTPVILQTIQRTKDHFCSALCKCIVPGCTTSVWGLTCRRELWSWKS